MFESKTGVAVSVQVTIQDADGVFLTGIEFDDVNLAVHLAAPGSAFGAALTLTDPDWSEVGFGVYRVNLSAGQVPSDGEYSLAVRYSGFTTCVRTFEKAPQRADDVHTRLGAPAGASIAADIATVDGVGDAIKAKTDNLPSDPADQSLVTAATDAIYNRIGAPAGASIAADIAAWEFVLTFIADAINDIDAKLGILPGNAQSIGDALEILLARAGHFAVVELTYAPGTDDVTGVEIRAYDSEANKNNDDGETGLIRTLTQTFTPGAASTGVQSQLTRWKGGEP